jgi:lyso-ornithine lipid O-acyltransferase
MTWGLDVPPPAARVSALGRVLAVGRGVVLGVVVLAGLAALLPLRLVERVTMGARRPLSPFVVQAVCRVGLWVIGLRLQVQGQPMRAGGAMVANHASWLDILALNAAARVFFVAKSEVAGWPGIGALARAAGTVFIARDRRQAGQQKALFEARLSAGHRLLFFPEGTSSDGARVLPFKSTLFEAFFTPALRAQMQVQPVSVIYTAPTGQDARLYGWWGGMELGAHFVQILSQTRRGSVRLIFHPALALSDMPDRKALAQACETAVRQGMENSAQTRVLP